MGTWGDNGHHWVHEDSNTCGYQVNVGANLTTSIWYMYLMKSMLQKSYLIHAHVLGQTFVYTAKVLLGIYSMSILALKFQAQCVNQQCNSFLLPLIFFACYMVRAGVCEFVCIFNLIA